MFDSHAHVAFYQFDDDRTAVLTRAKDAKVSGWLEIGTDLAQSRKAVALAKEHNNVWAAVGVHPSDITELNDKVWRDLEVLLSQPRVVAVGEVGLDYYHTPPSSPAGLRVAGRGMNTVREKQLAVLERFVAMSHQRDLPVVFHVRDGEKLSAHDDLIAFLRALPEPKRPRGVIHTFSGSLEQARRYLALGLYLSFSGVVTYKNAGAVAEVASSAPLNRILVETDCPFLTPEPHRGARNEPAYIPYIIAKIAALRGVPPVDVATATTNNARTLFALTP